MNLTYIPPAKAKIRMKMTVNEEYFHIGEKVDMEGAEKWYRLGARILGMKKKRREPLEKEHYKKKKSS